MSKQPNHEADISNRNWGTPGTNKTWDQAQGNRGKQMNPNQQTGSQPQPASPAREGAERSQHGKK